MTPAQTLDALLSEPPHEADARARGALTALAGEAASRIVLMGAGGLGRASLAGLREVGQSVLAFVDNKAALWGSEIEGVPVFAPAEAAQRFGSDAVFVVCIWGVGLQHRFVDSRRQLRALGVAHIASFVHLYWAHLPHLLPYYPFGLPGPLLAQSARIRQAFELWHDPESERAFLAQLRLRLQLDWDGLGSPAPDEYFGLPRLPSEGAVLIDAGAYDGDSLPPFVARYPAFSHIIALEPDPHNFARLAQRLKAWPEVAGRVTATQTALGAEIGHTRFAATGTMGSGLSSAGPLEVALTTVDALCHQRTPSLIKMDIEGAELSALHGATQTIDRHRPALAICSYHVPNHLWEVPLLISEISHSYQLSMREHDDDGRGSVCYALPKDVR